MTTVGYGDILLYSPMGRAVGVILALWGGIFTALFIITILRQLNMSVYEERSLMLLDDLAHTDELQDKTA